MATASTQTADFQPPLLSDRHRWTIVALLSASITINLLDRQVLSVLAPLLRSTFNWTNAQYGYVGVAFNLGMMLGQIPAGQLMDRVGTRKGLLTIFTAWSLISILLAFSGPGSLIDTVSYPLVSWIPLLTGVALGGGLAGFLVLRFLMGLAECGNYTAGIKALAGLFPAERRGRAGGFFNAGAQLGSVIAPPIVVYLAAKFGWRMGFVIPAVLGMVWVPFWLRSFPDKETFNAIAIRPKSAVATATAAEYPISRLFANRKVLGLCLIRIFTGPITTFYWTWLPLYLRDGRGMSFLALGIFASIPNLIGMSGNVVGGLLTDKVVTATGSVDRGRKVAFTCAFLLGALSMTMPWVSNNVVAVLLMGLALFGNQWVAATYIGTVGDVVPQHLAGRVNGIAGLFDNGAALLAVLYTGVVVDKFGWTPVFLGAGALPFLAMISVFFVLGRIEPAKFD
jgi:ACS family hexuronate transporter-like MFS transporter